MPPFTSRATSARSPPPSSSSHPYPSYPSPCRACDGASSAEAKATGRAGDGGGDGGLVCVFDSNKRGGSRGALCGRRCSGGGNIRC
ncbi:unnamed protein product [Linum tenue]|uniref:Uncharacterized protein n=1 Tax=Linum tenue TaxID=586396 RepID=A0AAV0HF42_9ROSI|nr:unnamed protein product [Linum tenue]